MTWADLAVRATGLATHLAGDADLAAIDAAADRAELTAALARIGIDAATPRLAEAAARARAPADLAVLERWAADRDQALRLVGDEIDRDSLRALVRGLVGHASAEERLAATMPTARLPAPLLQQLAAATGGAEVAALLAHHEHPAAAALADPLRATPLDLLAVERALAAWFASRARGAHVDHALEVHAAQVIDVANAGAAVLLAARGGHLDPAAWFVTGGTRLTRVTFVAAATSRATAAATLAEAFAGTPLAHAFAAAAPGALEDAALSWHLATQRRLRRQEPLGLAAVLWLVLARRAELRRVRRAAWYVALRGRP